MDYIGENLLPRALGNFFIVLSLVASVIATFSYFRSVRSKNEIDSRYWKNLARIAFITEVISVFSVFAVLFYIIHNHLFEYHYAWKHSSLSLEFKYLLACFWEGQEGSFLLWSMWHCILGLILIKTAGKWESPVMTVLSFAQFCLATMIAGFYIFDAKLGSNPFILLRDSGVLDNAPALHLNMDPSQPLRPDYLASIKDGNDLNPLLQNYWMVIHPPVLFLGFAATIVPFAYTIAGLWTKKYGDWTKQALPSALLAAAVLGVGIMMGAKWAYESLTFGGYWAWDPVENASLVPWLILVAGIHTLLIYRHTGHSLRATCLFFILAFGFILYSTFLTRSGILGDTSVHAFTDLGMNFQLLLFLLIFVLPALFLLIHRYRQIPAIKKEESTSSREFWMFIGSLVFFLSALLIIGQTSLPVINKLSSLNLAPPDDPEFSYNSIQVYVAIIVALLTAIGQYFKYRSTPTRFFRKKILIPTIISVAIASLVLIFADIDYSKQGPVYLGAIWIATAASIYAIVANAAYIWVGLRGNIRLSGGSISHIGFAMVLLGILLSASKKEVLSFNTSGIAIDFGAESKEKTGENLTLVKGVETKMGKYLVTYESDSAHPKKELWYYRLRFKTMDGKEEFILRPNAFVNYKGNEGLMANPDSRHYWDHDVFTYITSLPNQEKNKDTATFRSQLMKPGDTAWYSKGFAVVENINSRDHLPTEGFDSSDVATVATLKIHSQNRTSYIAEPLLINQKGTLYSLPDTVHSESLIFRINKLENGQVDMGIKESNAVMQFLTLKAYVFPYINILWIGIIITALGILLSMVRRISLNRKNPD